MKTKYFTLSLISLLIAAGCNQQKQEAKTEKKATNTPSSICRHPSVPTQLHGDLQAAIVSEAQKWMQSDDNQFVDIDKITAAANQLKLTINGIQEKEAQCRGKVSILIPQNIQKVAQINAPLVGIKHYDTIIEERMGSENFQFNGSTLTLPINFSVSGDPISITQQDQAFQTTAVALSSALLPYGVKDNLNVAGRTMTREMALQAMQMNGGKLPTAAPPRPATQPEIETTEPKPSEPKPSEPKPTETQTTKPKTDTPKPLTPSRNTETPEQKALREAKAAEAAAKLAAEKAAARAAKAKAAREAAEAAKLETAKADAAKAKAKARENQETKAATSNNNNAPLTPQRDFVEKTKTENKQPLTPAKPRINDDELDKVRKAHNQADQDIKSSWKKISPEIQKELVEEQKSWERNRNQRCRQAASAGKDESEANKLYMQCDTRMTKERVKNLEGYSIP